MAYTLAQVLTCQSQLSQTEQVLFLKVFFRIWGSCDWPVRYSWLCWLDSPEFNGCNTVCSPQLYINYDHNPALSTLKRSVIAFNKCLVPNLSLPSDEVTNQKFAQLPLSFCPNLSKVCG